MAGLGSLYSYFIVSNWLTCFLKLFERNPNPATFRKKWLEWILDNWYCAESLITQNRPASHLSQAKLFCVVEKLSTVINHGDGWDGSCPGSRFYESKSLTVHCNCNAFCIYKKKNGFRVFFDWPHKGSQEVIQVCPAHAAKPALAFQWGGSSQLLVEVSVSLQFSGGFRRSLRFLVYSYLPWFLSFRPQGVRGGVSEWRPLSPTLKTFYTHLYH